MLAGAWWMCLDRANFDALGQPQAVPGWGILWQSPERWAEVHKDWLRSPAVAGLSNGAGRRVFLLCANLGSDQPPDKATVWMLDAYLQRYGRTIRTAHGLGAATLGPWKATESLWVVRTTADVRTMLLRVAVTPAGVAYAILLETELQPTQRDLDLITNVAESVQPLAESQM